MQVAGVEPTRLLIYGQRLAPHEHLRDVSCGEEESRTPTGFSKPRETTHSFSPNGFWDRGRRAIGWPLHSLGTPERIRTSDPLVRNQVLSPLSYRGMYRTVSSGGLEPPAPDLSDPCSHQLSYDDMGGRNRIRTLRTHRASALAGPRLRPLGHPSLASRTGLEPAISAVTGRRPLHTGPTGPAYPTRDSNPQPPRSERDASTNWATRASWTTSVSNRAGAACKAALHTCASPEEPTAGLEPAPFRLRKGA